MPLWPEVERTQWTDQSPVDLHDLFLRYQARARGEPAPWSAHDENYYVLLLMHVISMQFKRRKWWRSLPYEHLLPEDVAQETLKHLLRKTKTMKIRAIADGYRPLLTFLNGAVYWHVLTQIQTQQRKLAGRMMLASEYFRDRGCEDDLPARDEPHSIDTPELEELARLVLSDDAQDRAIGDLVARTGAEAAAIEQLYGLLAHSLLEQRAIVPHALLSSELRQEVSLEQHAIVTARLIRVVHGFACATGDPQDAISL